ncbi:hypothetical protein ACFT0G_16245, partial [Streptomyces sp. NPDC057020]|uniref:hypothetical protein n=1 Tax=Streptomyces sp. NPDC057020 TaxID=3346002 RepID=UPI00363F25C3
PTPVTPRLTAVTVDDWRYRYAWRGFATDVDGAGGQYDKPRRSRRSRKRRPSRRRDTRRRPSATCDSPAVTDAPPSRGGSAGGSF